jgi:hypothetical protein
MGTPVVALMAIGMHTTTATATSTATQNPPMRRETLGPLIGFAQREGRVAACRTESTSAATRS